MTDRLAELIGLAACLLLKNLTWYEAGRRERQRRCPRAVVGRLERIVIYPVKSCRGIELPAADIADSGIVTGGVRDRSYVVLNEANGGRFVSLKTLPQLSAVQPLLDAERPGRILLSADGHPTVPVTPSQRRIGVAFRSEALIGLDCGDEVAAWLNGVCGGGGLLRLVHCASSERGATRLRMRQLRGAAGAYAEPEEAPDNLVAFADVSPILLLSDKSLQALDDRLAAGGDDSQKRGGADWRNFRPNLVVSGVHREHEEDDWDFVLIGAAADGAQLSVVFQCERCAMVNLAYSPDGVATLTPGNRVLGALAPYRSRAPFRGPLFGVNCAVEAAGRVALGDAVLASTATHRGDDAAAAGKPNIK